MDIQSTKDYISDVKTKLAKMPIEKRVDILERFMFALLDYCIDIIEEHTEPPEKRARNEQAVQENG